MLGIIGAMEIETIKLSEMINNAHIDVISGIKFISGKIFGKDVVVAQCFEGKVNAAIATQTMILKYKTDKIINSGVAGGLLDEMNLCDIAVGTAVVQHDFDITPLGYKKGMLSNISETICCAGDITEKLTKYAKSLSDTNVFNGIVATGDQFINSTKKQKQLREEFNAVCAEMEGASIGQVCFLNNVDFCILRAISDKADDNSNFDFREFVAAASDKTVRILTSFIKEM